MSIAKDFKDFIETLVANGFRKAEGSDGYCWIFKKQVANDRVVDVQIWNDGAHRASHMLRGCGSTPPTDFTTIDGMLAAIQHETTRTDQKVFLPPGSPLHFVETRMDEVSALAAQVGVSVNGTYAFTEAELKEFVLRTVVLKGA